jgi:S-layer protein (TIGR01567 family)
MKPDKQQKKRRDQTIVLIVLVVVVFAVPTSAETLEIRGEVAELTTTQSTAITWDAYNFDVFWCDLDGDLMTETLTIAAGTLTGPNTDRTIDKNCLSYQTSPAYQQYELYENEGLTVRGDTGYYLEGFMGGRYVAINGRADKLCKHLVEFEDDDKKTLATGEAWDLGGGFALTAENLSCPYETPSLCDSCTLSLSKNGVKLDEQIIYVNTSDMQDRVYTYAPDIGGEEHVPVFSCYMDAVYNGTENDIVQLKHVFLIDDDVLKISIREIYGVMEVMAASSSYTLLKNMDAIDLDAGSIEPITGDIHFKTADDDGAIRFYPLVEYSEPGTYEIRGNVAHLDGAQSVDLVWDASNFAGFWHDMDNGIMTEQLKLLAGTINSATGDRTINKNTLIYTTSPVYQHYKLYTNEGLAVDSDHPGGDTGYWIEGWIGTRYVAVDSKADKLTKLLVEFDRCDVKTLNPGDTWRLGGGFVLELVGINDAGNIATLQLFKNAVPLEGSLKCIDTSTGIKQDRVYTYLKDVAGEDNVPIFSCYVAAVFRESSTSYVQLKYAFLIDDDIMEIQTHDTYGDMEVVTANAAHVRLENEGTLYLDEGCTEWIVGGMYFEIADDPYAIRFCPLAERTIDDEEPTPPPDVILAIDSDGDGVPNVWDDEPDTPTSYWTDSHGRGRMWGDMNGDCVITSVDALMIMQAAAGGITL